MSNQDIFICFLLGHTRHGKDIYDWGKIVEPIQLYLHCCLRDSRPYGPTLIQLILCQSKGLGISDTEVIEARDLPEIRLKVEDDRKGDILEWKAADLIVKRSFEGVATYIDYDGTIYVQVVHEGKDVVHAGTKLTI